MSSRYDSGQTRSALHIVLHLGADRRDAVQRVGIQLLRARWERLQNTNDLAREAVSCNAGLGGDFGHSLEECLG